MGKNEETVSWCLKTTLRVDMSCVHLRAAHWCSDAIAARRCPLPHLSEGRTWLQRLYSFCLAPSCSQMQTVFCLSWCWLGCNFGLENQARCWWASVGIGPRHWARGALCYHMHTSRFSLEFKPLRCHCDTTSRWSHVVSFLLESRPISGGNQTWLLESTQPEFDSGADTGSCVILGGYSCL